MGNAAIKLKSGDTLFKGRKHGRSGKDMYNSDTMTYSMSPKELNELRFKLKNLRHGYDHQTILEDIKVLSKLESRLAKSQFKVAICGNHEFHCRYVKEALYDNGITNVVIYNDPRACVNAVKMGNFNLVLTQYDFHSEMDGKDIFTELHHNENAFGELVHVCIVNGFTSSQFMHLKRAGLDVLNCFLGEEGVTIFKDCIRKLSTAYYMFHLVEMVLGKEDSLALRKRKTDCNLTLENLESMANKSKFRIMLAMPNTSTRLKFTNKLKQLGFTKIDIADSPEDAICAMDKEDYSLVLSSYRFSGCDTSGDKIYKTLKKNTNMILIDGYEETEMLHLSNVGIMMLDKTLKMSDDTVDFWEEFGQTALGFYVKFVRDRLSEVCN